MARVRTPRGWLTSLKKDHGKLGGKCFQVCLSVAAAMPDLIMYCEGFADGKPHAWLAAKHYDPWWAVDPTWGWKYPSGRVFDHVDYHGIQLDGLKVFRWLKARSKKEYTSSSIMKYAHEIDLDTLK